MKKFTLLLIGILCTLQTDAMAAVVIKKAAPVSEQKKTAGNDLSTMLPTVLNIVQGVKELKKTTKELTAECIPTSAQINFVNDLMKEYAKTGAKTADEIMSSLRVHRCSNNGNYRASIELSANDKDSTICFDYFDEPGAIWDKYPKAVSTYYCTDGSSSCSEKERKYVSNMYELYHEINFSGTDFTPKEAQNAQIITNKIEDCSSIRLSQKKRELWSDFLKQTIGGLGQKTNTASIMEMVGQSANNGTSGIMNSLTGFATQFMAQ